ncbi:MAG: Ap4A phosphorylase II [Leptolyngbyaceae cyanobacterium]
MTESPLAASALLWPLIEQTTRQALDCGALYPIATQAYTLNDHGIPFLVRLVDSLIRKEQAQKTRGDRPQQVSDNPFLPYEEALFVANLSPNHVCLLNKFNVVEHHLLIITREYAAQQDWLTPADFTAFARCGQQINGLGFYNSGPIAGASQHHKHLQLVPLAIGEEAIAVPLDAVIHHHAEAIAASQTIPTLPFQHRIQPLTLAWAEHPCQEIGVMLHQTYQQLLQAIGIPLETPQPEEPYNLLMTREWMMVVRRSQASYQNIGVNSLGYAGWLLVKTIAELEQLRQLGPLALLEKVGLSDILDE